MVPCVDFVPGGVPARKQMVTCPNLQPLIQAKHNTIFQTDSQSISASQVATSLKTTKSPSIPIYLVCKIPSLVGQPWEAISPCSQMFRAFPMCFLRKSRNPCEMDFPSV